MVNRGTLLIAIAILVGVYCFLLSDSGIVERYRLTQEKRAVSERISRLEQKNRHLQQLYERYRNGFYTPEDFLKTGFLGPDEKAILIKNINGEGTETAYQIETERGFDVELRYMRIFWIIISAVIIGIIILRGHSKGTIDAV